VRSKYGPAEAEHYVVKSTNPVFRADESDMEAGTYITGCCGRRFVDRQEDVHTRAWKPSSIAPIDLLTISPARMSVQRYHFRGFLVDRREDIILQDRNRK